MRTVDVPEDFLSLHEDVIRWRLLLAHVSSLTETASLVGSPAPITKAVYERINAPRPGDIVYERSALAYHRAGRELAPPQHIVGRLLRVVVEPMYSPDEWDDSGPIPTEDVWYVQYGPSDEDVVRWTNCTFRAIPLDHDEVERMAVSWFPRTG